METPHLVYEAWRILETPPHDSSPAWSLPAGRGEWINPEESTSSSYRVRRGPHIPHGFAGIFRPYFHPCSIRNPHPPKHPPRKKDKTEFLGGASRLAHIDVGGFKGMDSQAEMADWRQVKPKGLFFFSCMPDALAPQTRPYAVLVQSLETPNRSIPTP